VVIFILIVVTTYLVWLVIVMARDRRKTKKLTKHEQADLLRVQKEQEGLKIAFNAQIRRQVSSARIRRATASLEMTTFRKPPATERKHRPSLSALPGLKEQQKGYAPVTVQVEEESGPMDSAAVADVKPVIAMESKSPNFLLKPTNKDSASSELDAQSVALAELFAAMYLTTKDRRTPLSHILGAVCARMKPTVITSERLLQLLRARPAMFKEYAENYEEPVFSAAINTASFDDNRSNSSIVESEPGNDVVVNLPPPPSTTPSRLSSNIPPPPSTTPSKVSNIPAPRSAR
jgi:hypothetical protein